MMSLFKKLNSSSWNVANAIVPGRAKNSIRPCGRIEQELQRIKSSDRYQTMTSSLLGAAIEIIDGLSFYYSFQEIFKKEIYEFLPNGEQPVIIDGGSNIGLSIIYFKRKYPGSQITGFEADPIVFEALQRNMASFGFTDVELVNMALWDCESELQFRVEGADGGRILDSAEPGSACDKVVRVPATRLSPWLDQKIDLLKLDIEGAEYRVLKDCASRLHNVQNIFAEYHSFAGERQSLDEVLQVLIDAGFRIQVHTQFCSPQPLIKRDTQLGMDLQLNIFGYREP